MTSLDPPLKLGTDSSRVYDTCSFADNPTMCTGSRQECAIRCAEKPPARFASQELAGELAQPFLDILEEAAAIVRRNFPGAEFYEADYPAGRRSDGWQFVFNVPPEGGGINTTAILHYVDGEFQLPPTHVDSPWGGDRVTPLPIHLGLFQALELASRAGYSAPVTDITLRWPLYPGAHEPTYIFAMPQLGVHVFVGVYTHEVHTSPLSRR